MIRRPLTVLASLALGAGARDNAPATRQGQTVMVVREYREGLAGVHAANPAVTLKIGRDAELPGESVLLVSYPVPAANPAARDVWLDTEDSDWSGGHSLSFRIKPDHDLRFSVSFVDRNLVSYTAWADLKGGVWQPVRVGFGDIRPNPNFQAPGAKKGAPLDVSQVKALGFAPQDKTIGHYSISRVVVSP